jgi:GT2 family glycosyltransferase
MENLNKEPLVSIIILGYNSKKFLEKCISSVLRQNYKNYEIIYVDNNSTDGSAEFVRKKFRKVKILQLKKNYGFAEGNNRGYRIAKGKYVVLLNPDTIVSRNWLRQLVIPAEKDPEVAAVSSMLFPPGVSLKEYNGEKLNLSPVCIGRSDVYKDNPFTLFPTGSSCLIRKKYFKIPFDKDYFCYQEDVYLGWKAWLQGYKVIYNKNSKVWHYGSSTVGFYSKFQVFYNERNRFVNILSFLKAGTILLLTPLFIVDLIIRILYFIFSLRFDLINAEFGAILWNILNFKKIMKKRKRIQKLRKVNDFVILNVFCENVYGKGLIKSILNRVFRSYFRLVKIICKILKL